MRFPQWLVPVAFPLLVSILGGCAPKAVGVNPVVFGPGSDTIPTEETALIVPYSNIYIELVNGEYLESNGVRVTGVERTDTSGLDIRDSVRVPPGEYTISVYAFTPYVPSRKYFNDVYDNPAAKPRPAKPAWRSKNHIFRFVAEAGHVYEIRGWEVRDKTDMRKIEFEHEIKE